MPTGVHTPSLRARTGSFITVMWDVGKDQGFVYSLPVLLSRVRNQVSSLPSPSTSSQIQDLKEEERCGALGEREYKSFTPGLFAMVLFANACNG